MKTNIIMGRIDVKNNSDWNLIVRPVGMILELIVIAISAIVILTISIVGGVILAPFALMISISERIKDAYHTISKKIRR